MLCIWEMTVVSGSDGPWLKYRAVALSSKVLRRRPDHREDFTTSCTLTSVEYFVPAGDSMGSHCWRWDGGQTTWSEPNQSHWRSSCPKHRLLSREFRHLSPNTKGRSVIHSYSQQERYNQWQFRSWEGHHSEGHWWHFGWVKAPKQQSDRRS